MKWPYVLAATVIALIIAMFEKRRWSTLIRKEKITVVTTMLIGWTLTAMLLINPFLPGPSHLLDVLFKPLVKWLHLEQTLK